MLEEIKRLGYEEQHKFLAENGFSSSKYNLKATVAAKGNAQQALEALKAMPKKDPSKRRKMMEKLDKIRLSEWSPAIKKIYLDGNNMFFVDSFICDLCFKRNRILAEQVIVALMREFCTRKGVSCKLVFANTKLNPTTEHITLNDNQNI